MIDDHGFPGILLMESAGVQASELILQSFPDQELYLILAGPGNNGGDGFVIGRMLLQHGKNVLILISNDPGSYKGDALINYEIFRKMGIAKIYSQSKISDTASSLPTKTLIVDALLGTGVESALRGNIKELIDYFRQTSFPVCAVDLPSGLNASTGELINQPIKAALTITFQLPKICHFVYPAADFCGDVKVVDIGIWQHVIDQLGIKRFVPNASEICSRLVQRSADTHKGNFGHLVLVGGSAHMGGAIGLSGRAALQSGAGLATVFTVEEARPAVYEHAQSLMCLSSKGTDGYLDPKSAQILVDKMSGKNAVAIGPGMGNTRETEEFLKLILDSPLPPTILDADALNILAENPALWKQLPSQTVLTPHPGEMSRLINEKIAGKRLEVAEKLAKSRNVVVVLKGAGTIIAAPDGRTCVNPTGNSGMSTAGSGDVLTGIIGSLLAQGLEAFDAAICGVYIHGLAGDLMASDQSSEAVYADGILNYLGKAFTKVIHESA